MLEKDLEILEFIAISISPTILVKKLPKQTENDC